MKTNALPTCNCQSSIQDTKPTVAVKKTAKSMGSFGLSLLIAFFPKCPLCLGAYLSMFGSFGLARSPVVGWLFPMLLLVLGVHLFLIFKKGSQKGYGPFIISLLGALIVIGGRSLMPDLKILLFLGMSLILAGSLWNSFSLKPHRASIFTA